MSIPAYWHAPHNVGDVLTAWLVERISGQPVRAVHHNRPEHKYFVTGSIITLANSHTTVWGAGMAWANDKIRRDPVILAVRGPLTRARALECGATCPDVLGDPALLLPRLYQPKPDKPFKIGMVPHLVDHERAKRRYHGSKLVSVIDVRHSVESVIEAICQCERIVSSSLHGLIFATAYGIPVRWAELSDKVIGDGTKFRDFFQSVTMDDQQPLDLRGALPGFGPLHESVPDYSATLDTDALWEACPFRA